MPTAENLGNLLRGGEFYSPVQARLKTDDVFLSELRQPSSRNLPRHEHDRAYVTVVLEGDYLEGDRGRLNELRPFTAVFNPAGAAHSTLIGPCGASLFTIELCEANLRHLDIRLPRDTAFDRGPGDMLWPGLRLYSAFKTRTANSLVVEAHVLEMLGAIAGFEFPEQTAQRWFGRVKDRLQVRAACELLHDPEWPLVVIAAECGFTDQSHFTRVFRKLTGTTPAQLRRTLASHPARA